MSLMVKNYFELFGLPEQYAQCPKQIKESYIKLQQAHHPDRFAQGSLEIKRLAGDNAADINLAYRTLRDPILRAIYLLSLQGVECNNEASVAMSADFLMEQMELREQLAEIRHEANDQQLANIRNTIDLNRRQLEQTLETNFNNSEIALMCIRKMQFYTKLAEEVEALESACHY